MSRNNVDSTGATPRELSAVSAAFVEHSGFIKKFLTRYFSNQQDIEDVTQETFLRAYVAEQKKDIEQPKAYLFRIARNVALTQLTKKSAQITDFIEESGAETVIDTASAADMVAEAQQSLGIYCEAVAALSEKCRQVYILRKVHGLKHKEIAERMSLSVSSVEKYLLKGILECRAHIVKREASSENTVSRQTFRRQQGSS